MVLLMDRNDDDDDWYSDNDSNKVNGSFNCSCTCTCGSAGNCGCDETKASDWLFGLGGLLLTEGGTCEQPPIVLRNDASNTGLFTFL